MSFFRCNDIKKPNQKVELYFISILYVLRLVCGRRSNSVRLCL